MIIVGRLYSSDSLEEYENYDDKKISKMTDNQIAMALDDERAKAKRNASKIISRRTKEGKEEGEKAGYESGRKTGKKVGAVLGGLSGLATGAYGTLDSKLSKGKKGLATAGITLGGAALGYGAGKWLGGKIGKANGGAEGSRKGAEKGRKEAKSLGHDEIQVTTENARKFDEYARKHKREDKWETGFRKKLADEKETAKREAEKRRLEELERRRVQAEERKARAEEKRANTDRYRFYDEMSGGRRRGGYYNW